MTTRNNDMCDAEDTVAELVGKLSDIRSDLLSLVDDWKETGNSCNVDIAEAYENCADELYVFIARNLK